MTGPRRNRRGNAGFTLLELMVVCSLMTIVLGIVSGFLIASNKAVATASVRLSDTADSRTAVQRIAGTIQFATSLSISSDQSQLYALQADGTTCDEWFVSGGNLMLKAGTATAAIVTTGVTAPTAVFGSNSSYPGLVSVRFVVKQNRTLDPNGTSVSDTFLAENVSGPVQTKAGC